MRVIIIDRKIINIIIVLALMAISILLYINWAGDVAVSTLPIGNKVIVIDPGHGGVDPGTQSAEGILEKNINLEIAKKLRRLLEQTGTIVILTREVDEGLYTENSTTLRQKYNENMRNRRIMANEIQPDIFITIHMNWFSQSKYYGAQTFYKQGCSKGKILARLIQEELRNVLDPSNNRVAMARDNVYLLNEVKSTSILVECGFLSNPREAKLLNQPDYQEKIAWAIYTGIIQYYNQIGENNMGDG